SGRIRLARRSAELSVAPQPQAAAGGVRVFVCGPGAPLRSASARGSRPSLSPKRLVDQKLGAAAGEPDIGEHPIIESREFGEFPTLAPATAPQAQDREKALRGDAQRIERGVPARVGAAVKAGLRLVRPHLRSPRLPVRGRLYPRNF